MKIQRLFHVLVVAGASSTVGLAGCGSSSGGGTGGTGGASTGDGASCGAVCKPSAALASWTDCNGCCCWLPIGQTASTGSPICGQEPCCVGRGR